MSSTESGYVVSSPYRASGSKTVDEILDELDRLKEQYSRVYKKLEPQTRYGLPYDHPVRVAYRDRREMLLRELEEAYLRG